MAVDFVGPLSPEVAKDTIDITMKSYRKSYKKKLDAEVRKSTKTHKPFCFACAWREFVEQQEELFKRKGQKNFSPQEVKDGLAHAENVRVLVDIDSYWDPKHFTLTKEEKVKEKNQMTGLWTQNNLLRDYVCSKGFGLSMMIPLEDLEDEKPNASAEKPKK